jgi:1,4-dihydroxy-2-naphthoate octaprenyltransferase
MADRPLIFLSHAGANSFEASLIQFAFENLLIDFNVMLWSYVRDQDGDERTSGKSLKKKIGESWAVIFFVNPMDGACLCRCV